MTTAPAVGLVGKLRAVTVAMLQQALNDWGQMTGMVVDAVDAKVQNLAKRAQIEASITGPAMLVETRVEGRCAGPYFFVFPNALAAAAVGRLVMLPPEVVKAKAAVGLDPADIEAFKELANLLCGSSNNVLARLQPGLRLSQGVAHLKVQSAMPDLKARIGDIPDGETACVACAVKVDGEAFTVHQLLPLSLPRTMLA
jgi:chemotaxis protein CheY-P-specific phosphatase CheC